MPLNYKPISKIKIKRSETDVGMRSHILDDGEMGWVKENHKLYVGDGSTAGGIMVNIDNTATLPHTIGSTTTLTPYHSLANDVKKGMFLKTGLSSDPLVSVQGDDALGQGFFGYLDFYDLYFEKQRHWIHDHGMFSPLSLAYSSTGSYVRNDNNALTFPLYDDDNNWTSDTTTAYEVTYASAMDYQGAIADGTDYIPVATYDSEYLIQFKSAPEVIQQAFSQSSITLTHDILNHTSAQFNHIIYVDDAGNVLPLQFNGAGDGAVLNYNSDLGLNFNKMAFGDFTGDYIWSTGTFNGIGKPIVVQNSTHDATTRIMGQHLLARFYYGDPSGVMYQPQHSQFSAGRHLVHFWSMPENEVGFTPDGLYYTDPYNYLAVNDDPPYFVDAKMYISSINEIMYGPQNDISISDLSGFKGAAWLHLHGLQGSAIQFETRNLGGWMGMFSPKDSYSLSAYASGSTYEAFGMYLAQKAPCDFLLWTRGASDVGGNDPGTSMTGFDQFGSTVSNTADFCVNRFGGVSIDGCSLDSRTDFTVLGAQYTREVAGFLVKSGISNISTLSVKSAYGIKLGTVDNLVLASAANGSGLVTSGVHITRVQATATSISGDMLGTTNGMYVGEVIGENGAMGIQIPLVQSDSSSAKAFGINFGTITATHWNATGILIDLVDSSRSSTGIIMHELTSDSSRATGITIGPRSSGGACSTEAIWITSKNTRAGALSDIINDGLGYSIVIDQSGGGPFYFGDGGDIYGAFTVNEGMHVIGDSSSTDGIFTFVSNETLQPSVVIKMVSDAGGLKIDDTSSTVGSPGIQIVDTNAKLVGLFNHIGTLAISDTLDITSAGAWWVITYSDEIKIDAAGTGVITFSDGSGSIGAHTISYIVPQTGTGIAESISAPHKPVVSENFALGHIIVITGSGAGVTVASGNAYTGGSTGHRAPIILSDEGSWTDDVGSTLTLMYQRSLNSSQQYRYFWGEIGRSSNSSGIPA